MTFHPEQIYVALDYETFSEADLKASGGYEYSLHPSTEILCAAFRIGTRDTIAKAKTKLWVPRHPELSTPDAIAELIQVIYDVNKHDVVMLAHNSFFENCITRHVFHRVATQPTPELKARLLQRRWICTASLASALALPRKLDAVSKVLGLPHQKDMAGHRLMLKMSKPRKPTKHNPSTRHLDPEDFRKLGAYCVGDVDAEVDLFLECPPLNDFERKVWELDQRINFRGIKCDRPLLTTTLKTLKRETKRLTARVHEITDGAIQSTRQVAKTLEWLENNGLFLPNLQKKTCDDALEDGLAEGVCRELLEVRQSLSRASTAKYLTLDARSRSDSRVRDNLIYHGASTGRWSGTGAQLQNLPRGRIKDTTAAASVLATGNLELVGTLYGDPMEVFSSCLRAMLVPADGHDFHVADYSAVEARGVFWLADHHEGLKAFRDGRPMYEELAAKIFNVKLQNVTPDQRFVGKQATLGCSYNMGPKKFLQTCANFGQEIPVELAETAVKAYRETHAPVVKLWGNLERAAIAAVENPGKKYTINHTTWYVKRGYLWCVLPSGRKLAYREPDVQIEMTPWGQKAPKLYHWGVDAKTKQWVRAATYGGKIVENVVQAICRDLMAAAMLRIDATGKWNLVLSVHDELISEARPFSDATLEEFEELMATLPPWATGFPLKVAGWAGKRYGKQ